MGADDDSTRIEIAFRDAEIQELWSEISVSSPGYVVLRELLAGVDEVRFFGMTIKRALPIVVSGDRLAIAGLELYYGAGDYN